ncbi:AsnC family transcriptional regulator [Salinadaptatus halalkaliphilus]|uniref:AsnC family transcriptional regulator n=1 Tax=Salinadaptatus halalkaliphilus TaxID=2419781 RepID=A0A4S3TIY1_9EURY|nr:AsnC family transcriptional regulator [Salinadaptatus halalkaliphilus]THE63999.1 AsnC family transcriptional regulator [Salinadaptatus halalkaliphilus]
MRDKRDLDQTDLELIRLLAEDARRPYSELAEVVNLSPPAVSDRIDRLQEQGVIRKFTIDIDRLKLQQRTPIMITFEVHPNESEDLYQRLSSLAGVEHAFKQYDGTIVVYGNAPESNPIEWLREEVDLEHVENIDFEMVEKYEWTQHLDKAEFSLPCQVCDNTVKSDGITATIGERTLAFCCPSCKRIYEQEFEEFQSNSD